MDKVVESSKLKGRPSNTRRIKIADDLRKHWVNGTTAHHVVDLLKKEGNPLNYNTVKKYFREWSEEIEAEKKKDYFREEKESKNRGIAGLENILDEMYMAKDDLMTPINRIKSKYNAKVKAGEVPDVPDLHLSERVYILNSIMNCLNKKTELELAHTLDKELEEEIERLVELQRNKQKTD